MKIPKSKRARRVGAELQKIVAEIVRREAARFAPGALVSVPEVRVSDDLAHANLYVSILGAEDPAPIERSLVKLLPKLRSETARAVRIRKLPEFHYVWDDTAEHADRIERLIDQVHADEDNPEDETSGEDDRGEE
jgi:ribosome-binding factor A